MAEQGGEHEEDGGGRVVKEGGNESNEEEVKSTPGVLNVPRTNNLPVTLISRTTYVATVTAFVKRYLSTPTYSMPSIYPI